MKHLPAVVLTGSILITAGCSSGESAPEKMDSPTAWTVLFNRLGGCSIVAASPQQSGQSLTLTLSLVEREPQSSIEQAQTTYPTSDPTAAVKWTSMLVGTVVFKPGVLNNDPVVLHKNTPLPDVPTTQSNHVTTTIPANVPIGEMEGVYVGDAAELDNPRDPKLGNTGVEQWLCGGIAHDATGKWTIEPYDYVKNYLDNPGNYGFMQNAAVPPWVAAYFSPDLFPN